MSEHPGTIRDPETGRRVRMTWRQLFGKRYWSVDGETWFAGLRLALDDGRRRGVLWFTKEQQEGGR